MWHSDTPVGDTQVKGFQLWIALPAAEENTPAQSIYLTPSDVPQEGPARALRGRYGEAKSPINALAQMTYLSVSMRRSQCLNFLTFHRNIFKGIYVDWLRIVAIAQRVHSTYRLFQPI